MGQKTKIDWCDSTWNPVTGCLHGCEYCYARRIAERFGLPYAPELGDPGMEGARKRDSINGMDTMLELQKPYIKDGRKRPYPMGFLPTLHRYRLDEPQRWTKPRTIFVGSMTDLFGEWVPDEWIDQILTACLAAPQHRYLFLTKNGYRYTELAHKGILVKEDNFWYGCSVPTPETPFWWSDEHNTFASIEPILEPFDYKEADMEPDSVPDWIIVGAETGNRKGKVKPKKDWIDGIVRACNERKIPLFMKESLRGIMGNDFRQEYPWD